MSIERIVKTRTKDEDGVYLWLFLLYDKMLETEVRVLVSKARWRNKSGGNTGGSNSNVGGYQAVVKSTQRVRHSQDLVPLPK